MSKTDVDAAARKAAKKEEKKKRKHSEVAAAEDAATPKKEKKDKKRKSSSAADGDVSMVDSSAVKDDADDEVEAKKNGALESPGEAALVPFANPLCDEKSQKKVLKGVKKAAKSKALRRGVKECVKSIRKSPLASPHTTASTLPPGIVVLAADISPMDVISHIPVLCEDHGIPYVYVPSRAELGAAGNTKRPTSVVMIGRGVGKGVEEEKKGEWEESYGELFKVASKLGEGVKHRLVSTPESSVSSFQFSWFDSAKTDSSCLLSASLPIPCLLYLLRACHSPRTHVSASEAALSFTRALTWKSRRDLSYGIVQRFSETLLQFVIASESDN
nr:h/aca ribonucleoprotein complex subunit 2 [Quercus suber]